MNKFEEQLKELELKEKYLCNKATAEIKKQKKELRESMRKAIESANDANSETWHEISDDIAEMAKLSFLLYTLHGIDTGFEISNHVAWVELKTEYDECPVSYKYARYDRGDYGELLPSHNYREALEILREMLKEQGE